MITILSLFQSELNKINLKYTLFQLEFNHFVLHLLFKKSHYLSYHHLQRYIHQKIIATFILNIALVYNMIL